MTNATQNKEFGSLLTVVLVIAGVFSIAHYYHSIKLAKLAIKEKEIKLSEF